MKTNHPPRARARCVKLGPQLALTPRAVVVLDNWSLYGTELKDGPGSFRGSRRPLFENRSSSPVLVLAGEVEVKIL